MAATEGYRLALSTYEAAAQFDADLADLVHTFAPLLFRVAHSVLRSRPEAEDVVQDTFVRVLQHRDALPSIRDRRVWIVRIAWNLALDRRRRVRPDQLDHVFAQNLAGNTVPADQALDQARQMEAVLDEIDRLPKAERHVLLLSATQDLDAPEIAAILHRSESATRALLFRARTRLRQRLRSRLTRVRGNPPGSSPGGPR